MDWTAEQLELKDAVLKCAGALNENLLCQEKYAEFSFDKWQLIKEIGILGLPLRREYGGLEQDVLATMRILETLGNCCEDAGFNFVVASHIVSTAIPIQQFGTPDQQGRYLPCLCSGDKIGAQAFTEPGSGSDTFSMQTWAAKNEAGYLLNGHKVFISNGPIADLFVVYARTIKNPGSFNGFSAFLVDRLTPGLRTGHPVKKMGLRTAPVCEIYFKDCQIAANQLLGEVGHGASVFNYVKNLAVLCHFAIHIGEMARIFSKCIGYSQLLSKNDNASFKFQSIAHKIVDMKIALESARAMLYKAGHKFQHGRNMGADIAIAKVLSSENYVHATLEAIEIFGTYGYMTETGIEKDLRNAVASKIYSGTTEMHRNTIASQIGLHWPDAHEIRYDPNLCYANK